MGEVVNLERKDIDGNYYTVIASKNKAGVDMIYRVPDGVIIPEKGQWVHTAPTNRDKPVQEQISYNHWQNVVQNADIGLTGKDIHQHDLRHIITTFLEDEGVPKELRKQVIGHKENDMIGRYSTDTHARADLKAEAVQFFLNKVFNRIDRDLKWEQRNS
jgi:integrase